MKPLAKLASSLQIRPTHSINGNAENQPAEQRGAIPDTATPYEKQITLYAFSLLQSVYGQKFRSAFKDEDELINNRRQWANKMGRLDREEVEVGIERLKTELERGNKFYEWPDIGRFIGICRRKEQGAIKLYQYPFEVSKKPVEEQIEEAKVGIALIRKTMRRAKAGIFVPVGQDLTKCP